MQLASSHFNSSYSGPPSMGMVSLVQNASQLVAAITIIVVVVAIIIAAVMMKMMRLEDGQIPESQKAVEGTDGTTTTAIRHGDLQDYWQGLDKLLGEMSMSKPTLEKQMKMEHRRFVGRKFVSGNYKIKTCPFTEWNLIVKGEGSKHFKEVRTSSDKSVRRRIPARWWSVSPGKRGHLCSGVHNQKERCSRVIDHLAKEHDLSREETIGILLYTGPMFTVYNALLEKFPQDLAEHFVGGFNVTIRVIASAIQKLSRRDPRKSSEKPKKFVFRGTGGHSHMPYHFWEKDEGQNRGFTLFPFVSTTTDIKVAFEYSGASKRRPHPAIYAIERSEVYPGASVQELSQFPHEVERIYPPCCYVEPAVDSIGRRKIRTETFNGVKVLVIRVKLTAPQYQPALLPSLAVCLGRTNMTLVSKGSNCSGQNVFGMRIPSNNNGSSGLDPAQQLRSLSWDASNEHFFKHLQRELRFQGVINVLVDVDVCRANARSAVSLGFSLALVGAPAFKRAMAFLHQPLAAEESTAERKCKSEACSGLAGFLVSRLCFQFEGQNRKKLAMNIAKTVHSKQAIELKAFHN